MNKETYAAPTAIELGDFTEETGFIGWVARESWGCLGWGW